MKTGKKRALELIAECKEIGSTFLDLGNLELTEVPEEILECGHLKRLNLGFTYQDENGELVYAQGIKDYKYSNQITDYSFLQNLTGLTSLDLSGNQITDISFLQNLTGLTSLNLRRNQITDISFLQNLTGLTSLDLSGNQITDYSFLQNLTGLTSLDLSSNQITDISFLQNLTGLTSLNLSLNQITDYSFLQNLTGLTSLDLSENEITDISFLQNLTGLTSLNLSFNQITDISFLQNLTGLTSLDLSRNQITDISFLQNLTGLTSLVLRRNQITDISFLQNLTGLTSLDLSQNQITDYSFLQNLTGLTSLDLSGNQITDYSFLQNLTGLTSLVLSRNQITDISFLQNLTGLTSLVLSGNQITDYSFLQNLTGLTYLVLWNNQITDISFLQNLTGLTSLDLSQNQITDISFLQNLTGLTSLVLRRNQITDISFLKSMLNQFQELEAADLYNVENGTLNLTGNPMEYPPPEVLEQGIEAVKNYFAEIEEEGVDNIYEAKTLVIGEGGAGKTSLCKKIMDDTYELTSEKEGLSTEGIDILQHKFGIKDNREFTVNLWDFGGQSIYHSTHQFFLTKRSLYLIVTDSRKDDTDLQYWLHVQQLLAGDSPVWIIQNEKQDRVKELKQNEIRGAFPNVKGFLRTNLNNNRGLPDIVQKVESELMGLPHIGDQLPKTWVAIRKALEERTENHITNTEFLKICNENGIEKRDRAYWLSEYLHDLGVILHFQDDDILQRMVILNNDWGTAAVYRVLDAKKVIEQKGKFDRNDLKEIWDDPEYQDHHLELLRLMEKFKLCYPVEEGSAFMAPQLLPVDQPEYPWDAANNLQLKYHYEFMPKGIITRLIVEMNQYIHDGVVWNTGVLLEKDGAVAEVMETYSKNEITIRVRGASPENLRTIVMHEIDKINGTFQHLKVEKLVPCNCETCEGNETPHFFGEQQLLKFKSVGRETIPCGKNPLNDVVVLNLLLDARVETKFDRHDRIELSFLTKLDGKNRKITIEDLPDISESNLNEIKQHIHESTNELKQHGDNNTEKLLINIPTIVRSELNETEEKVLSEIFYQMDSLKLDAKNSAQLLEVLGKGLDEVMDKLDDENDDLATEAFKAKRKLTKTNLDFKSKLKISLPLIPTILKYEAELSGDMVKELKARWEADGWKAIFMEDDVN